MAKNGNTTKEIWTRPRERKRKKTSAPKPKLKEAVAVDLDSTTTEEIIISHPHIMAEAGIVTEEATTEEDTTEDLEAAVLCLEREIRMVPGPIDGDQTNKHQFNS